MTALPTPPSGPEAAALEYAARGWRVVPIIPGKKHPPIDAWQNAATTDPTIIRRWWALYADHGVGIATGARSGLWVLDVDVTDGKNGDEALADLEAEHGPLPDTVEVVTGSGGRHIYFAWPAGLEIRNDQAGRLGYGLDVRGEGGQVLAPPTIHPTTGRPYEWELDHHPETTPLAPAPAWLIELLTSAPDPVAPRLPRTAKPTGSRRHPGEAWADAVEWDQMLTADGATYLRSGRDRATGAPFQLWARPGVHDHHGASLGYGGTDVLKLFTDGWTVTHPQTGEVRRLRQEATYTRFGYYAARFADDDGTAHREAAKYLAGLGFGDPLPDGVADLVPADDQPDPGTTTPALGPGETSPPVAWTPLRQQLAAPPTWPIHVLPQWAIDVCVEAADRLQVPVDLCAQLALGCLAAALAGHATIGCGQWREHLNLYLSTALPSGAGKSPASKLICEPLRELEKELVEKAAPLRARWQAELEVAEGELKQARGAGKGAAGTKEEIVDALLAVQALQGDEPPAGRMLADDATPEALTHLLAGNGGRMAVLSTEADVFDMACGLYTNGKAPNLGVYLKGWSGEELRVDRRNADELRVPQALLTVSITVQPAAIEALKAKPELAQKGFVPRFMLALPGSLVGARSGAKAVRGGVVASAEAWHRGFSDMAWRARTTGPHRLEAGPEALAVFEAYYDELERQCRPGGRLSASGLGEWVSKLRASVLRTAGILHLAHGRHPAEPVAGDVMAAAVEVGRYWTSHRLLLADELEDDPVVLDAEWIEWWTGKHKLDTFTKRQVEKATKRMRQPSAPGSKVTVAEEAIELLLERGHVRASKGRRADYTVYEVVPAPAAGRLWQPAQVPSRRTAPDGTDGTYTPDGAPFEPEPPSGAVVRTPLATAPERASDQRERLGAVAAVSIEEEEEPTYLSRDLFGHMHPDHPPMTPTTTEATAPTAPSSDSLEEAPTMHTPTIPADEPEGLW